MSLRPHLAGLVLSLAIVSCSSAPPKVEEPPLAWPEAPDPPRIAYVKSFSRPDEAGIDRGFLERLADVILGASDARIVRPMAVLALNGAVFVADPGARGVHRFDIAQGRYDLIGEESGGGLPSPVGLAKGSAGEVFVTDSALAAVLVIRPGAKAAARVPLPAMAQPTGIAFDPANGRLFVVDTRAHRINVFNRDGSPHASFGQRGTGDGDFNYPTQLWRDARGRLYVTDSLNFRIQILDGNGRFVGKFGQAGDSTGDFMRHKGLATDRFGHVYVVDALLHAFQIFDDSGRLLLSVGELGRKRGEFWLPAGIFIGDDDMIYVADSYNQRIQVFRYIGGPT
jgi:streptogramin lyase